MLKIVSTIILSIFILFFMLATIMIAADKENEFNKKYSLFTLTCLTLLIFVLVTLWVV